MGFALTLDEIGNLVNGTVHGPHRGPVSELGIDSRTLIPSESTLFIALVGDQHDGHDFVGELYESGIRCFLVSRLPDLQLFPEAGFCLTGDTLAALQELASARRRDFGGLVAAITGSNGKTIVKEWIFHCLNGLMKVHRSPKSYNSQVGVPLSVWLLGEHHQLGLIEAGISRRGEMAKLQRIIQPRIGLLTNLGSAHQENFESLEQKLEEKLQLFKLCDRIICCADQTVGGRPIRSWLEGMPGEVVDWSLKGAGRYNYSILKEQGPGTVLSAELQTGSVEFTLPFRDSASIENALHTLTFAFELGIPEMQLLERISTLEPVSMRLEILKGTRDCILINDSYNSDIAGVSAALDLVEQQDHMTGTVVILSDLLQSGLEDRALYAEIARLLKNKGIDSFIGIGPALMKQRALFPDSSMFFVDTEEFLSGADRSVFSRKAVLIKGSRRFGFERITADLQLKTHQTLLEIDLNAMVGNLNVYRSRLKEGVKTMVVVKALSYGTGSAGIAGVLQYHKVDWLAVAFIDEGIELRRAGIHLPIMVLNPDPSGFEQMMDYGLEPEIYSFRGLKELCGRIRSRGIDSYPLHIKLDTGMHRLGFREEEIRQLLGSLRRREFRVTSVFTHLAAAEDPAHDPFTLEQIKMFERMASRISEVTGSGFYRHVLNSAGIERFPEAQFEMVRLGIGLHGVGSLDSLRPVSTFKSAISQIRSVKSGETVGYGRAGMVHRDSMIATIPVGYADGLCRTLGNGAGSVWINGGVAPTIGNICMDMTMIDVTGLEVSEGDEVEIFGKNQPLGRLAEQAGTIPYEMLTAIPERVKRVYLQE